MKIDLCLIGKRNIMQAVLTLYNSEVINPCLILDCGCGRGAYAYKLTDESYVGLDINPLLIRQAHELHSNSTFIVGDARKLPFRSKVFDCVICSEVLEHIQNDQDVLKELARVLKPFGKLILSVPNIECKNVFVNWQRSLIDNSVGHLRGGYSFGEISNLIENFGFGMRRSRYNCGPITALIEYFLIKLGNVFGYSPSNLNQLYEGEKLSVMKVVLRIYEMLFPFLFLITYLDRILPKRYRSNIAFLAERVALH